MDKNVAEEKMAQLEWYITKHCLWQYNSRAWDRLVQNERILTKTKQLLRGENAKDDIAQILDLLKERMDHTMVHASLNQELVKEHY